MMNHTHQSGHAFPAEKMLPPMMGNWDDSRGRKIGGSNKYALKVPMKGRRRGCWKSVVKARHRKKQRGYHRMICQQAERGGEP